MRSLFLATAMVTTIWCAACGGDSPPPRSADDESEQTDINRAHENFKAGVGEAAGDTRDAVEDAQDEIQGAATEAGDDLGVRKSVTGAPEPDGKPGQAAPKERPVTPSPSTSPSAQP